MAQLDSAGTGLAERLRTTADTVERAAQQGADLVVLPEQFLTGSQGGEGLDSHDPRLLGLAPASAASGPAVATGFCERDNGHAYNSAAYVSDGQIDALHRKVALVAEPPFEEHRRYDRGDRVAAFDTPHGRCSLLICNDLWEPSLPEAAARDGAGLLIAPVNSVDRFDGVDDLHAAWSAISIAYALLLHCHVVFVNRVGVAGPVRFWGGSQVVAPGGRVIAAAPRYEEALVFADLELTAVGSR
ncbi:MAG: nitrilase-related carbon-nitrogen hydrolase [Solirubrobacteraceae bacterium]